MVCAYTEVGRPTFTAGDWCQWYDISHPIRTNERMKIKDFRWYVGVLVIDAHSCSDCTFQGWGTCGHHLLYLVKEEGISILL